MLLGAVHLGGFRGKLLEDIVWFIALPQGWHKIVSVQSFFAFGRRELIRHFDDFPGVRLHEQRQRRPRSFFPAQLWHVNSVRCRAQNTASRYLSGFAKLKGKAVRRDDDLLADVAAAAANMEARFRVRRGRERREILRVVELGAHQGCESAVVVVVAKPHVVFLFRLALSDRGGRRKEIEQAALGRARLPEGVFKTRESSVFAKFSLDDLVAVVSDV